MSASTQLVPYVPIPDFFYQEDLSSRINAAFGELDKTVKKGKEEAAKADFEKLSKSFESFSNRVLSPLNKAGSWLEKQLSGIEKDAQAAQSLNADLEAYKALQYGASQSGADTGALQKSIKNVSDYVNGDTLHESLLKSLGVKTHDDAGLKRDNADIFAQVARSLGAVNRDSADFYALNLGIDDDTLHAMQRGLGQFAEEYQDLSFRIGGSAEQSADQSEKFMQSWRKAGSVFDLLVAKSGGDLAEKLAEPVAKLAENMLVKAPQIERVLDKIGAVVERFADIFVDALSGTVDWVTDVMAWWDRLDEGSQGLIGGLAGLTAAWLVLNSAFLASPVGIILSLAAAIGLLYNDYQKWKAGEESFIDWGDWGPVIEMAADTIGSLAKTIKDLIFDIGSLLGIDFSKWSISTIFKGLLDNFNQLGASLRLIGELINALKEGNWAEAANIGKSLVANGLFQTPAAKASEGVADTLKEKISEGWKKVQEWFPGKEGKGATGTLSNVVDNLSQPDPASMLLPAGVVNNERRAVQSDFSTASNSTTHSPTINSNAHIVVNGVSDPYLAATETSQRLFNVNSQLAQHYSERIS
ncbi:Uncharacterised protein [Cedecea lapagei]|uniref:Phage-related minor tail protein n=1 Tax=Cedecea lapagei TaxID=158823 RepID=A0A3S4JXB8_9ENTR|nr:hypothetical protein [Cedecea lapagei]VEB95789.1 Uncharacterised protein [Cedecea lapagei]